MDDVATILQDCHERGMFLDLNDPDNPVFYGTRDDKLERRVRDNIRAVREYQISQNSSQKKAANLPPVSEEPEPKVPREAHHHTNLHTDQGRTDAANATRLVDRFKNEIRFAGLWNKWLVWDRKRWKIDEQLLIEHRAKTVAETLWLELGHNAASRKATEEMLRFVQQSNDTRRIAAMVSLARSDPSTSIDYRKLNTDPMLLNVDNGTIDLKTGKLRPHKQSDLITHLAPVKFDASAKSPLWDDFIKLVLGGDGDLVDYVQRLAGYSITGMTTEHVLPVAWGDGENGKSTFWTALREICGDYSESAPRTLLVPDDRQHPTAIADLYGRRFVPAHELERGDQLNESLIKSITGDRYLKARRMREDFWEFENTAKIWIATNHMPRIGSTDHAIWRRVKLIPFTVKISDHRDVDKSFPDKLKAEYPGILNWLIQGCVKWQEGGLVEPKAVSEATTDYKQSQDTFGRIMAEVTYQDPSPATMDSAAMLFKAYQFAGGKMSMTAWGREMKKRFDHAKQTGGEYRLQMTYLSIRTKDEIRDQLENGKTL